jgi:hypothetical protein
VASTDHPKITPASSTTPLITDCLRLARGPFGTLVRTFRELCATKIHQQNGSNERHARSHEEHEEHLGCPAPRGPSAMYPQTVCQEKFLQPELDPLNVKCTFPLPDLPNQSRDCYQIIGEYEASLRDVIPTNL